MGVEPSLGFGPLSFLSLGPKPVFHIVAARAADEFQELPQGVVVPHTLTEKSAALQLFDLRRTHRWRRPAETRIADGVACSVPDPDALDIIWRHVARVVMVADDEIAMAMRMLFDDTHNVAEGAGGAAFAAVIQERRQLSGKRVAAVLTGGNVDRDVYREVSGGS